MERYLHVIYCDDIRIEAGNKQSLMGIYAGDLWVEECPAVLPKLCIFLNLVAPIDKPLKKLVIKVTKDDETIIEAPITDEQLHSSQANIIENGNKNNEHRKIGFRGSFVLSPFAVDKECVLRVRAETESEELIGTGLKILIGHPPSVS